MKYHITLFSSIYDNKTEKTIIKRNWNQFRDFMIKMSEIPLSKQDAPLISSAVFERDMTRSNANVKAWGGWCAFDVDGGHSFKTRKDIEEYFLKNFGDYKYIIYSTPTCSPEKLKFRIVFSLSSWITDLDEIRAFWFSMNKHLTEIIDKQTKDLSRMFFPPGAYKEAAEKFIIWNDGASSITPSNIIEKVGGYTAEIMMDQHKKIMDRLPDEMKQEIERYRKRQMENDGKIYTWKSFRDCPFVDKKAVSEYATIARTDAPGRYRYFYVLMVSIASNAIKKSYPITEMEIEQLVREIDQEIDGFYNRRKLSPEIQNAISYAYKST